MLSHQGAWTRWWDARKDTKDAVLAGSNFVVADMRGSSWNPSEAAKTDGYKGSCWIHLLVLSTWRKSGIASVAVDADIFENDQEKPLLKLIEERIDQFASDKLAPTLALSPVVMLSLTIPWWWQKMTLQNIRLALLFESCSEYNIATFKQWTQENRVLQWQVESRLLWAPKKKSLPDQAC